jgi:hypothetical protein
MIIGDGTVKMNFEQYDITRDKKVYSNEPRLRVAYTSFVKTDLVTENGKVEISSLDGCCKLKLVTSAINFFKNFIEA